MKTTPLDNLVLVANQASGQLAEKIGAVLGVPVVEVIKKRFCDGEIYHAFPFDIGGKDVIIVGATHEDSSHQELLDLIDGCHCWNADTVNVVVPFLGYSTMERFKPNSGEIPKGITRTRQIFRARPDYVAFIDLHSEAILHAHDGGVYTKHIQTDALIAAKIRELDGDGYVLVSPDYGRSKWVAHLATLVGLPHTAADKDRFAMDKTMVGQVASVVHGKVAIICDDMIRTGGSILQTVERCLQAGARDVMVMATHLVLCGNARQRFAEAGISKILGADTYPGIESDNLLDVYSVAPLVADVLKKYLKITGDE